MRAPVRGKNFADTMLVLSRSRNDLQVVNDQLCTPSFVSHVAKGIFDLLGKDARGIYHVVNDGSTSWHSFASELFSQAGIALSPKGIPTDGYPTVAPRPRFSVLGTKKFTSSTGYHLPHWKQGISDYIEMMQAAIPKRNDVHEFNSSHWCCRIYWW